MWRVRSLAVLACCASLYGSGCDEEEPPPSPPQPTAPEQGSTESNSSDIEDPFEALTAVDLLHGVPTTVAVSSIYRGEREQMGRLVDGDTETAWNSASGDLTSAWLEVEVPDTARVETLRLTVGYTKRTDSRDLFTSNHRIRRVRVKRDGQTIADRQMDTDDRGLQEIQIETQPGGTFRIEFSDLLEGSRDDWREVCVSELQVLGRSPDSTDGRHSPDFRVGGAPVAEAETNEPPNPETATATASGSIRWLGSARPGPNSTEGRGTSELVVEAGDICVRNGSCLAGRHLPALSTDGTELALLVDQPFGEMGPTYELGWSKHLLIVRLDDFSTTHRLELVTEGDAQAHFQGIPDCCRPNEENCDPFLCEPDDREMRAVSRRVKAAISGRVAIANRELSATTFRGMLEVPTGIDENRRLRNDSGLLLAVEIEEDSYRIAVTDQATTSQRWSGEFQLAGDPGPEERTRAWFDPPTKLLIVEVMVLAADYDETITDYVVAILP